MRIRHRRGFTIVELLVALALILFIMSILSQAFVTASQSFNLLKAVGDMAERMRSAATLLRHDLAADHFEAKKRLSQPDFWNNGPPINGFFRLTQFSSGTLEGTDLDGFSSFRSTDHSLHFTVKLRGNNRGDYFTAQIPIGSPLANVPGPDHRFQDSSVVFNSQWAEVAYFLVNTGDNANGTPLFALYRRYRLAVPDNAGNQPIDQQNVASYPLVSIQPTTGIFNSPFDLTVPSRRFGMAPANNTMPNNDAGLFASNNRYPRLGLPDDSTSTGLAGADVILTDVVSFDVRLLIADANGNLLDDTSDLMPTSAIQTNFPNMSPVFGPTNQQPFVFDTWSQLIDATIDFSDWNGQPEQSGIITKSHQIPIFQAPNGNKIQIKGIQIILRCWDFKTSQTRQMTIFQDL